MSHNFRTGRSAVIGSIARGVVLGGVLCLTFFAGFWLRGAGPTVAAGISPVNDAGVLQNQQVRDYVLLAQTQALLDEHYLRTQPPQSELEYGAIRGLLATLQDKYTFFIDPPVAASESNVLAGKYGGIGVQLVRDELARFVLYPFRDGPAAKAGVQDGDILIKVNGADLSIETRQDAVDQMLRGEVKDNNGVKITVQRPSTNEELEFQIPFAEIEVPSVIWRVLSEDSALGYIQILRFTNRTPAELEQAITELRAQNIKGAVIDLRNNPGGLLQESVQVAGQFMNGGTVLIEERRDGENNFDAGAPGKMADLPLVVIVNGGTASAGELVAGALQDSGRAVLLGQQTYGKGSIQLIFSLADKSSIHITTAEWLTPKRNHIDGKGLTPDVPMIPDPNGRDVELGEAIRVLQGKISK
ncbi:MAG: S41 family peptidase [Anaerolineae bacterium]|nr:S41 family peptidase [Anaerolineae bacterium]